MIKINQRSGLTASAATKISCLFRVLLQDAFIIGHVSVFVALNAPLEKMVVLRLSACKQPPYRLHSIGQIQSREAVIEYGNDPSPNACDSQSE